MNIFFQFVIHLVPTTLDIKRTPPLHLEAHVPTFTPTGSFARAPLPLDTHPLQSWTERQDLQISHSGVHPFTLPHHPSHPSIIFSSNPSRNQRETPERPRGNQAPIESVLFHLNDTFRAIIFIIFFVIFLIIFNPSNKSPPSVALATRPTEVPPSPRP